MAKKGERWALDRYWECGPYQFKFVFDGNWSRHLGSAGDDRLAQPGENIALNIAQSGEYTIWLEPEEKKWGLARKPNSKPRARIRVSSPHAPVVLLDATTSVAREGHPFVMYEWQVSLEGDTAFIPELSPSNGTKRSCMWLPIHQNGKYRIRLTVGDGKVTDQTEVVRELGHGFLLHDGRNDRPFQPIRPGLWGTGYGLLGAGIAKLEVRAIGSQPAQPPLASLTAPLESGRSLVVLFDEYSKKLSLADEGYTTLIFTPSKETRLPAGLIVERVCVAGSFNNWSPTAHPLEPQGGEFHFSRLMELPEGVHHYQFVVNGSITLDDMNADPKLRKSDGKGGFHSGIRIGPDPASFGPAKPNDIACGAVRHDPHNPSYFTPIADDLVRLTVRTLKDDVDGIVVDFATEDAKVPLARVASHGGFDYWSATCQLHDVHLSYTFYLRDRSAKSLLDSHECYKMPTYPGGVISLAVEPFETEVRMSFETPDWAKRVVWYQIFPERFANGDPANDPPRTVPWKHQWDKPYKGTFEEKGTFFQYIFDRRYGGDLQGVQQRLGYLRDLGITGIYFNPVFHAASLHKYDAADYRHIDDHFGVKGSLAKIKGETTDPKTWQWSESDKIFLDFLQEAHRQGYRVIIDGVFNHVGREFWAFQDVLKNGKDSPYAGWFDVTSWEPFQYVGWDGPNGSLPRLKHDDALGLAEPVREHLFAVTRRWMDPDGDGDPSDGIDGWRLDVASDINANFWRDWRKLVKSINPDAYIVAELWEESRPWLDGQTFDAVMNYPFARSCQRFFVNKKKEIKPSEMERQIEEMLGWYPPQVNYVLQNLFDSHDTDRVASMFMNPDLEYDQANRLQDNGPSYNTKRPTAACYHRLKSMAAFQMMFLGAPMVYYGDEVGMFGADDPSDRKPMFWEDLMPYDDPDERIEPGLYEHYRRTIAIRNTYPALQLGSYQTLLAMDNYRVFAFARALDGESIVVVVNNGSKRRRLDVPSPWPNGTKVMAIMNPEACELAEPSKEQPAARPTIRAKAAHRSALKVELGRLKGMLLPPRTTNVFAKQ
ncbi:MAG TPA: alpha amylase N-terminal ig-like domain-containing protein [Phycisphaerae bacterium]|nr:alpha amylase N-terminal ig-like domain-containing protein [Phycisphaerae bacterium]